MQRPWVSSPSYEEAIAVIIRARKNRGFSQDELAKRLGKHQSFVAKIETRQRRLDIVEFIVVARALDIDPASLLNSIISELKTPIVF